MRKLHLDDFESLRTNRLHADMLGRGVGRGEGLASALMTLSPLEIGLHPGRPRKQHGGVEMKIGATE